MNKADTDTLCKLHDFLASLMRNIEEKLYVDDKKQYDNVIDIEMFRNGEVPF